MIILKLVFCLFINCFFICCIKSQTINNPGPCTCDLTRGACDVNCCCDTTDCSATDRQTFSTCLNTYSYENVQSCFQSSIIFQNSTPFTVNIRNPSLFCIYFDRFSSRNFYLFPSLFTTDTEVTNALNVYGGYSFPPVVSSVTLSNFTYHSGDAIQILYSSGTAVGYLPLPTTLNSPYCIDSNPVRFLLSSEMSCIRQIGPSQCATLPSLNVENFYKGFKVSVSGGLLSSNLPDYGNSTVLVAVAMTCTHTNNNNVVNCTVPSANATHCLNVLRDLTYTFVYQSGTGFTSIQAIAVLIDLPMSTSTAKQKYTTVFRMNATSNAFPRSGNPGYLIDKPVMAGTLSNNTLINLDPSINKWLTMPASTTTATSCDTTEPIVFGRNVRVGCLFYYKYNDVTSSLQPTCNGLNQMIRAALGIDTFTKKYIATLGNATVSNVKDWVEIFSSGCENRTLTGSGNTCSAILTGVTLDILYSRTGSVTNPQNKILGARLNCTRGLLRYQCALGTCNTGTDSTQKMEAAFVINFIDTSKTPVSGEKVRPVFAFRLPSDFFYPLFVENNAMLCVSRMYSLLFTCYLTLWISHYVLP